MIAGLHTGMAIGHGPLHGAAAWIGNVFLVVQFPVLHSLLLSTRGRTLLLRLAPAHMGADLSTTTYALIASLQLLLTFLAWSPSGIVWLEPHGLPRVAMSIAYGLAWIFLLKTMVDAGLALQTGYLGWSAVARGRAPEYREFSTRGTFRYLRQPVYLAFTLTLWTGSVWTPDHLLIAVVWTVYCLVGPALKERRYLQHYGARFARYRALVPYWLPSLHGFDPRALDRIEPPALRHG